MQKCGEAALCQKGKFLNGVHHMPKICYVPKKFAAETQSLIDQANKIFAEYEAAGYILTLRQLYYQFVSRDLLPNKTESYKRLGSVINDARLAGLIDWE